jgi:hypothetical protein
MGPFVIVKPDETLDLPVRLRPAWSKQLMNDAEAPTRLLEAGEAVAVPGALHRKRQCIVGQHGFDAIRQLNDHLLQEGRGGRARLLGRNRHDGFPAESSTAANS